MLNLVTLLIKFSIIKKIFIIILNIHFIHQKIQVLKLKIHRINKL